MPVAVLPLGCTDGASAHQGTVRATQQSTSKIPTTLLGPVHTHQRRCSQSGGASRSRPALLRGVQGRGAHCGSRSGWQL